jgi:F-type H+-transporting ATPase subunit b
MRRLKAFMWLASTPIALVCLLAEVRADEPALHAESVEDHGAEHFVTNPIENFLSWGYRDKLTNHGHKMPPPFSMNLVNFAAFAFLLGRYAGPSIKRAVRERHDEIARALAESGRLRDEARRRLDEYERKMAALDGEIATLVANIRAEADAEKNRIISEGQARAERMQRDAQQQINAEIQRVRATLEREVVVAAVSIAEKLLQEKTNDADQRALADKFVKGLGDAATKRRPRV